jgi:hypothetical protein
MTSRGGFSLKAHTTPQHLFTDIDLGRHMRYRAAGLDHRACSLLPELRVSFLRLPDKWTSLPWDPTVPLVRCPLSKVNPKDE